MTSSSARDRLRAVRVTASRVTLELVTTVYAALVLAVVEATIRWVPLPTLSSGLRCPVDLSPSVGGAAIASSHELGRRARRELRCAQRVADAWPLSHGPCLRRALVGGHLLRRFGTRVRLGTYDDGGSLAAHAWLEIDGRPLENVSNYRHFVSVSSDVPVEHPT